MGSLTTTIEAKKQKMKWCAVRSSKTALGLATKTVGGGYPADSQQDSHHWILLHWYVGLKGSGEVTSSTPALGAAIWRMRVVSVREIIVVASCRFVGIFAPSWYVFCHDLRKSGQAILIRATVSVQNARGQPFIFCPSETKD